jgi:hypothetical protein
MHYLEKTMTIIVGIDPGTKKVGVSIVDLDGPAKVVTGVTYFDVGIREERKKEVLYTGALRNGHGTIQVYGYRPRKIDRIVEWDFIVGPGMDILARRLKESMGIPAHLISAGPRSGW